MNELLSKAVDKFEIYHLVDIYEINNLKLQGFRIRGASSVAKTQRMKTILKNDSKLREILKKTALFYKEKKGKDFSWTLVSKLDIKIVEDQIKETNFGEVALALIDAEKLEVLEPLLVNTQEIRLDAETDKVGKKSHSKIIKKDDNFDELRMIIEKLEVNNKKLTENLEVKRRDLKKEKEETKRLSEKLKNIERKFYDYSEEYKNNLDEITLKNEEIAVFRDELEKMTLENINIKIALEEAQQTKMLFLGTKYYQRYIDRKIKANKKINYIYISDSDSFEDYPKFEKVVLLAFTMNKTEVQNVLSVEEIRFFKETHNLIIIETVEYFNEYIDKVGQLHD